nr:hypothetical protein [Nevskia sp.]
LYSYAKGTVYSDADLELLPGYPFDEELGTDPDTALIETDFRPKRNDDPVLIHFVLPQHFIPRRDLKPLEQPIRPFVDATGESIVATYAVTGPVVIRFWISQLQRGKSISDYDHQKLLHPDEEKETKLSVEFNFGVFKLKLE